MKTKNAYSYRDTAEALILNIVTNIPKTTHRIQSEAQLYFTKIHFATVKRLLNNLWKKGKVRKIEMGRYDLWSR